jgi:hypothetical protein
MSIFRKSTDYYLAKPKVALPAYRDLTMPRRDWLKLAAPSCWRLPARSVCAAQIESQERA